MEHLAIDFIIFCILFPLIFVAVFFFLRKSKTKLKNAVYVFQTFFNFLVILILSCILLPKLPIRISFLLNFEINILSLYIVIAIAISNLLVLLYNYGHGYSGSAYYDMFLCILLSGLMGTVLSGDIITSYVFMEIVLFSAGYLIYSLQCKTLEKEMRACYGPVCKGATKAAYKYIFMNIMASFFILASIIMLFSDKNPNFLTASGFLIGLLIKAGAFPFHFWIPDVYTKSPVPVAALLAGSTNAVVLFTFYKFIKLVDVGFLLQAIGLITMFLGSLLSIGQVNIRRIFSYLSITETGFIIYAFGVGNYLALVGAFILLITQIFSKTVLFEFAGLVTEHDSVLTKHYGLALFALLVGGFSIAGIPLTGGFAGKYAILLASFPNLYTITTILSSSFFVCISILKVFKHLSLFKGKIRPHYTIMNSLFFMSILIIIIGGIPFMIGLI